MTRTRLDASRAWTRFALWMFLGAALATAPASAGPWVDDPCVRFPVANTGTGQILGVACKSAVCTEWVHNGRFVSNNPCEVSVDPPGDQLRVQVETLPPLMSTAWTLEVRVRSAGLFPPPCRWSGPALQPVLPSDLTPCDVGPSATGFWSRATWTGESATAREGFVAVNFAAP